MSDILLKLTNDERNELIKYLNLYNCNIKWQDFLTKTIDKKTTYSKFLEQIKKLCWVDTTLEQSEDEMLDLSTISNIFNPYNLNSSSDNTYLNYVIDILYFKSSYHNPKIILSDKVKSYPEVLKYHFELLFKTFCEISKQTDTKKIIIGEFVNSSEYENSLNYQFDKSIEFNKLILLIWCNLHSESQDLITDLVLASA